MTSPNLLQAWLATRPPCVQKLAAEFPINSAIDPRLTKHVGSEMYFVFGYTEDDRLVISAIDPHKDYEGALANRKYVCASHLRDLK